MPCFGSAICAASRESPIRPPSMSFPCSTAMPMSLSRRFMSRVATFSSSWATARSQFSRPRIGNAPATRQGVIKLNKRRVADGLPITEMYLGLHVGEVFYGNVGSTERLDFTVIGPAVNEVSRIAAMCRSVEQPMLVSAAFAGVGNNQRRLVSVGRYALRGVGAAQELFTLDPSAS